MKIDKAVKFKIHPTVKQQKQLTNHLGCARFVYNYFLQYKTDQYRHTGKSASFVQMSRQLTLLKKESDKLWLNNVSRQCIGRALADLDSAFNNFFQKRADYPRKKNRYTKQSFRTGSPFCSVRLGGIHLPLIGIIKCKPEMPKEYKLKSITISKTPTNKYYASINIETEIPNPVIDKSKPIIGIDFGLKTFITTSTGEKISHPQPFKKMQKQLRRAQRCLYRRKKESKRREAQRGKVALIHEKISNQRRDFLHKLSSKMIHENQAIFLEDLSLKGMQVRLRHRKWGRKISDLGWRIFTDFSTYKGNWYGCLVGKIDRFWPSSKICSECGFINHKLTLKDREWTCSRCGKHHDRDENAAKNIKQQGMIQYGTDTRNLRTGRGKARSNLIELSKN